MLCVRVRQTNQQIRHHVAEADRPKIDRDAVETPPEEPTQTAPRFLSRLSFWKNR